MPDTQGLTNWQDSLYQDAIKHLQIDDVVIVDANRNAFLSPCYLQKIHDSSFFWLVFSTGVELLIKSVLLRHDLLRLKKRKPHQKSSINVDVNKALEAAYARLVSSRNTHINGELHKNDIHYLCEINTPTLGPLAADKGIDLLVAQNLLSKNQGDLLSERIRCFAFIRRNVEAHVFLSWRQSEIGKDLSLVYIPMLNQLMSLL